MSKTDLERRIVVIDTIGFAHVLTVPARIKYTASGRTIEKWISSQFASWTTYYLVWDIANPPEIKQRPVAYDWE